MWQIAIDFSITTISRLGIETCALLSRPMSFTNYHEISVGMVVAQSTVRTLSRRNQKGLLNENGKISKFSFKILMRPNLFICSNTFQVSSSFHSSLTNVIVSDGSLM